MQTLKLGVRLSLQSRAAYPSLRVSLLAVFPLLRLFCLSKEDQWCLLVAFCCKIPLFKRLVQLSVLSSNVVSEDFIEVITNQLQRFSSAAARAGSHLLEQHLPSIRKPNIGSACTRIPYIIVATIMLHNTSFFCFGLVHIILCILFRCTYVDLTWLILLLTVRCAAAIADKMSSSSSSPPKANICQILYLRYSRAVCPGLQPSSTPCP